MKFPTLTVIIASYGRPGALHELLEGLLRQSPSPDEIIAVNQQPDPLDPFTARLRVLASDSRIRLLEPAYANAQRARNLAISEARGDILILLDDDVRIPPDFVEKHLRNYENDPSLDGVAGQVLEPGQEPTDQLPPSFHWPHNGWMFFPLNFAKRSATINWPSCNASIRRELAIKVGGFDEQFVRTWWDDTDFSWRLHKAGAKIVYDPAATLVHLRIASGGKRPAGSNAHVWYDTEAWGTLFYFWRKNFGLLKVWRHVRWWIRAMICRKALLVRPHWLLVNLLHLGSGYRWASKRLHEGPIYINSPRSQVKADDKASRVGV